MRYHFMQVYDDIIKALNNEDLPCGPAYYPAEEKPFARLIAPIVAAPLASFATLPQAWIWYDWIKSGRLGRNLVPSGDFDDPDLLKKGGWEPVNYETEDVETLIRLDKGGADKGGPDKKGRNLYMSASPRKGLTIDSLSPIVDHPIVAVRSPTVKVGASQVYRISVMVFMRNPATPGAGGMIVRDSIGGERLQFRTPGALTDWFEVVYYRRAPVDGTLSVTLGMANYGWAAFDDFKIEPIVEQVDPDQYKRASPSEGPDPRRRPRPTPTLRRRTRTRPRRPAGLRPPTGSNRSRSADDRRRPAPFERRHRRDRLPRGHRPGPPVPGRPGGRPDRGHRRRCREASSVLPCPPLPRESPDGSKSLSDPILSPATLDPPPPPRGEGFLLGSLRPRRVVGPTRIPRTPRASPRGEGRGQKSQASLRSRRMIVAPPGSGVPRLRRLGLEASSGRVVAFLEDSCLVLPGWLDALLDAFEDHAVVAASGVVEHADDASKLDWAVVFCEYAPFLPPVSKRPPARLAGNNFAVDREIALRLSGAEVHETALLAAILREGRRVRTADRARVRHVRRFGWREAFGDRFRFGLEFGRLRTVGAPPIVRWLGLVAGPAIYASQVARLTRTILGKPRHLGRFVQALPITLALLAAWSLGEWLGWCLGPPNPVRRDPVPARKRRGTAARTPG